nr:phosphate acyltransferase [Pseudaminobacter soli]
MPAFHSAAISTKMLQELGGSTVIGPVLVGLNKPVQIVSLNTKDSDIAIWRQSRRIARGDEGGAKRGRILWRGLARSCLFACSAANVGFAPSFRPSSDCGKFFEGCRSSTA